MKKVYFFLLFFALLLPLSLFSQRFTSYAIMKMGYTQNNGNYGVIGAEWYLVAPSDNILSFSTSAQLGSMKNKFLIIPEGEVSFLFKGKNGAPHSPSFHSAFYKVGLAVNPYALYPNIGLAILSLLELNAGYNFQFSDNGYTNFEGFRFGVVFHIPI